MNMDKDKLAAEKLKAKMTKKQKLSYVWYYYKIQIIVGLIVIIFTSSFILERFNNKDTILHVTVVSPGINTENLDKLTAKATDELIEEKKKAQILITFTPNEGANNPSPLANQKLTVQIAAGELDVLVLPKAAFEQLAANGAFLNLEDLEGMSAEALQKLNFVKYKINDVDTTARSYGIKGSSFTILKELAPLDKDTVLAVLANGENKDMSIKFIQWLLEQNSL